jgi:methionyl-tRNA formyltransferase
MTRIRFLGYDATRTRLIAALKDDGCAVEQTSDMVADLGDADVNISFGYRHILPPELLKTSLRPVINLHIGYLPYNRGAHPNFWAFYDNTPSGVTIHEIDEGIDTGPICFQRYVNFDHDETTFAQTHRRLLREVEDLFIEHKEKLLSGSYEAVPQRGAGSLHRASQLPAALTDWNVSIRETLRSLDQASRMRLDLQLVDEIQQVRTRNNVNWMDLLRIALKASPSETKRVLRRINSDDNRISELFRRLGEE